MTSSRSDLCAWKILSAIAASLAARDRRADANVSTMTVCGSPSTARAAVVSAAQETKRRARDSASCSMSFMG